MSISKDIMLNLEFYSKVSRIDGGFLMVSNETMNNFYKSRSTVSDLVRLAGAARGSDTGDAELLYKNMVEMSYKLDLLKGDMVEQVKRLNSLVAQIDEAKNSLEVAKSTSGIFRKLSVISSIA